MSTLWWDIKKTSLPIQIVIDEKMEFGFSVRETAITTANDKLLNNDGIDMRL